MATRQPRVPGAESAPQPNEPKAPKGSEANPLTDADAAADLAGEPRPAAAEVSDEESYREQAKGLRAKDVDATRLRRSVLTLDGWVCPATSPAPKGKE
jgi:hypothetical protein